MKKKKKYIQPGIHIKVVLFHGLTGIGFTSQEDDPDSKQAKESSFQPFSSEDNDMDYGW